MSPANRAAFYVYILASQRNGTLYIRITRDLAARLRLHQSGKGSEFVARYRVFRLVYVEIFDDPREAIAREKQLKNWNRAWKLALIEKANPQWLDLAHDILS